jgi:putative ABC transport system ATP-binding protein
MSRMPHDDASTTTTTTIDHAVSVEGVQHCFGSEPNRSQVLHDNHLQIRPGEVVIMTGPSGSGKTTLLTLIGTLRRVQEGSLRLLGHELLGMSDSQIIELRKQLGFIFQAHNLFDSLTATENVRMATELVGMDARTAQQRIVELLTRLQLGKRLNHKPHQLSGGQKQRVAVARGLVHRPKIVLADEPTAALDKESSRIVVSLLKELAEQEGTAVVIVTHDNRILDVADRIVNMVDGRIKANVLVKDSAQICNDLRGLRLFADLGNYGLAEAAKKMQAREYKQGDYIVREGEAGDEFYLIFSGRVDVRKKDANGQERSVNTIDRGGFFGELALLQGGKRNASIVAMENTACYALSKETFLEIKERSESFDQELREVLFSRQ